MKKLGRAYQELVGLVSKSLDPDADIKIDGKLMGPDGWRDVDVEVRGTISGKPHFTFIECKDLNKKVGIGIIDALKSKTDDLSPDKVIIASNGGFTKPALRKAERLGFLAISALATDNELIKLQLFREIYAQFLSIDTFSMRIFYAQGMNSSIQENFSPSDIYYNGLPVQNWMAKKSKDFLHEQRDNLPSELELGFQFKSPAEFIIKSKSVMLRGFIITLTCSSKWKSQIVQEDVTLGYFDHITRRTIVPDKESYILGGISPDSWEELSEKPDELNQELEPDTFRLNMTFYNPIRSINDDDIPEIDELIVTDDN